MNSSKDFLRYVTGSLIDYAICVDVNSNKYTYFSSRDNKNFSTGINFFNELSSAISNLVGDNDRVLILQSLERNNLLENLKHHEQFTLNFCSKNDFGDVSYKEVIITWFDKENNKISIIQKDITTNVEFENNLQTRLNQALTDGKEKYKVPNNCKIKCS